jgi:transposase
MLTSVYGNESLSCIHVFEWLKTFREGCDDSENDPRSGQPSTAQNLETVVKVHELVARDHQVTLKAMEINCTLNRRSFLRFFMKIWKRKRPV